MNFGIIADGNRRWARENNLEVKDGHYRGFLALKDEVLPVLLDHPEIHSMTVYAFSTENWKRSPLEVKNLMTLFENMLQEWVPDLEQKGIKLVHAGRKDRIPQKLNQNIEYAEQKTQNLKNFTLYLCLDYGSQNEIIRAVEKTKTTNEKELEKNLDIPPLDIIVRTGGEQRLSNFCLWQAAYAELFFIETKLPAITQKDIVNLLNEFQNRQRRRGK
jgi:undecaprenyl diphosphate synthase